MTTRRQARRGQVIVGEAGSNSPLDQYRHEGLYSSILKPLELKIESGVHLIRGSVRPREIVQDTVPGGCDLFIHVTALRRRGDSCEQRTAVTQRAELLPA
jgi:hypothetical protein